jgi:hypothetical protein
MAAGLAPFLRHFAGELIGQSKRNECTCRHTRETMKSYKSIIYRRRSSIQRLAGIRSRSICRLDVDLEPSPFVHRPSPESSPRSNPPRLSLPRITSRSPALRSFSCARRFACQLEQTLESLPWTVVQLVVEGSASPATFLSTLQSPRFWSCWASIDGQLLVVEPHCMSLSPSWSCAMSSIVSIAVHPHVEVGKQVIIVSITTGEEHSAVVLGSTAEDVRHRLSRYVVNVTTINKPAIGHADLDVLLDQLQGWALAVLPERTRTEARLPVDKSRLPLVNPAVATKHKRSKVE